jgi:ribonuclease BN (tRNA processing enzyme)
MEKEGKAWSYKMEALRTVNDTLTKRIQRYEEQEANLIESERRNEELEQQIEEFNEDLERIRNERKTFKEENHKLMKKVIQIEEAFKVKERDYEHKLKKINFKLQEFQKLNDTTLIEEKLKDKSNQVKLLVGKVKSIEDETRRISKFCS